MILNRLATWFVGASVLLHNPARFSAQCLEDLIVVAVLGKLVVAKLTQASENASGNGASLPFASLIVLTLLRGGSAATRCHDGRLWR